MKRLLATLALAGCAQQPGSFTVYFSWEEPPAPGSLDDAYVTARVEERSDPEVPGTILASAGPEELADARLELNDVPNGDHRVVVAEIREAPSNLAHVLYYGLSEPFTLRAGDHLDVEVRVALRSGPVVDDASGAASLAILSTTGYVGDEHVALCFTVPGAQRVQVSNRSSLPEIEGVTDTLELDAALASDCGGPSVTSYRFDGWDLATGVSLCADANYCPRRVFARFFDELGYPSRVVSAEVVVDTQAPQTLNEDVRYEPGPDNPLLRVDALAAGTRALVSFGSDESVTASTVLRAACPEGDLELTRDAASRSTVHIYSLEPGAALPTTSGSCPLFVTLTDTAGNGGEIELQGTLEIDTQAPSAAAVDGTRFKHVQAPWGAARTGGAAGHFFVRADADGVAVAMDQPLDAAAFSEAGEVLVEARLYDDLGRFLAASAPIVGGGWEVPIMPDAVLTDLYVSVIDRGGNESVRQLVERTEWIATLADDRGGLRVDNPLELRFTTDASEPPVFAPLQLDHEPLEHVDAGVAELTGGRRMRGARQVHGSPGPQARGNHALAYDALRGRVVLTGGFGATGESNDVWEWDGTTWSRLCQQLPCVAPPVRSRQVMVYDPLAAVAVVMGGRSPSGAALGDTWAWDGTTWQRWCPDGGCGVPGRFAQQMAFDEKLGSLVLVGGCTSEPCSNADGSLLDDFVAWDGDAWSPVCGGASPCTLPPARAHHRMAFDSARGKLVLYGGCDALDADGVQAGAPFDETWEWDADLWTWTRVCQACGPGAFGALAMAFDPSEQAVVLYAASGGSNTTWVWDGAAWNPGCVAGCAQEAGAPERYNVALTTWREGVVLMGGLTVDPGPPPIAYHHDDTWVGAGAVWERRCGGAQGCSGPSPLKAAALTYVPGADQLLLYGGWGDAFGRDETWVHDGGAWQLVCGGSTGCVAPPARTGARLAYHSGGAVLFGGFVSWSTPGNGEAVDQTWVWDGAQWSQACGCTGVEICDTSDPCGPAKRNEAAMAYDSARDRVYLLAGIAGDAAAWYGALDDLWEWDGAAWLQLCGAPTGCTGPGPRYEHAAAYDEGSRRLLAFGGADDAGIPNDELWEWDPQGASWRLACGGPSGCAGPSPRVLAMMVHDPTRQRTLVIGGKLADGTISDEIWAWSEAGGGSWELACGGRTGCLDLMGRADGAVAYDSLRQRVALVGGADTNGAFADLWLTEAGTEVTAPAEVIAVPVATSGLLWDRDACLSGGPCSVAGLAVTWVAGGQQDGAPGARLRGWSGGRWRQLAQHAAPTGSPAALTWSTADPGEVARLLTGDDGVLYFSLEPRAGGPPAVAPGEVSADYVEVVVTRQAGAGPGR